MNHEVAVVTIVKRRNRYSVIVTVPNKTSELVRSPIVRDLKTFTVMGKTLTYDNGKEFAAQGLIDQKLNSTSYFVRPFASRERGSTENLN